MQFQLIIAVLNLEMEGVQFPTISIVKDMKITFNSAIILPFTIILFHTTSTTTLAADKALLEFDVIMVQSYT